MIARLRQLATVLLIGITLAGCAATGAAPSIDWPGGYRAPQAPFPASSIDND
jgi:hypothetical protein